MRNGHRSVRTDRASRTLGGAALHVLAFFLLGYLLIVREAGSEPLDPGLIVSECRDGGPRWVATCPAGAASEPVATLRQPLRLAPPALHEPLADLLPVSLSRAVAARPAGARVPAVPQGRPSEPSVHPSPAPDLVALRRAQSLVRLGSKATIAGLDRLEDAASHIRPAPWRTPYDAAGWRLTGARLAGLTPFGGPDARLTIPLSLPAGRSAQLLRLRWNAGFDGAQVTDFAVPGLFAGRLMMARYYRGPLMRVSTAVGVVLAPMPQPAPMPQLRLLPVPAMAARDPLPLSSQPVTTITAVPLPPAAPLMAVPLIALGLLRRSRLRKP